jgi:hypothetical protein
MLGLLVQLGAIDDGPGLIGEHLRDAEVVLVERGGVGGYREVQHPDRPTLHAQRNHDAR